MTDRNFIQFWKKGRIYFYLHTSIYVYVELDKFGNEEWKETDKYLERLKNPKWRPRGVKKRYL